MKNQELFEKFVKILPRAWTQESIYPGLLFDIGIPAKGQCEPTACVVQEWFGGDIYKIIDDPSIYPKKAHYYNCIDGKFIDFTHSQFTESVPYEKGIKLTEKQCDELKNTAFCNRGVRYHCLSNRVYEFIMDTKVENISKDKIDQYRSAIDIYVDVMDFFDHVPASAVFEQAPFLAHFFYLMDELCYNRKTDSIDNVIDYLEDFLETGETPNDYIRAENPIDYNERQKFNKTNNT